MPDVRPCETCGKLIFFIKNSYGRYVPMSWPEQLPHFETCSRPPRSDIRAVPFDYGAKMYNVQEKERNNDLARWF